MCRATHRTDSILTAFGTAVEFKRERVGKQKLSEEERVVLSVLALDREVNNGGFLQFFGNSSGEFTATLVESLHTAGCPRTAEIAAKAVRALGTTRLSPAAVRDAVSRRSTRRDRILRECDEEFFSVQNEVYEIEPRLLAFIERYQAKIELLKGYAEQPEDEEEEDTGGSSPTGWIAMLLECLQAKDASPEGLRKLARQYASEMDEPAAEAEVEAAVALHEFSLKADGRSPVNAEPYARKAFDLGRQEYRHCLTHRYWVDRLTQTGHAALADTWALEYVEYLPHSGRLQKEALECWGELLRRRAKKLPRAAARLAELFPAAARKAPQQRRS